MKFVYFRDICASNWLQVQCHQFSGGAAKRVCHRGHVTLSNDGVFSPSVKQSGGKWKTHLLSPHATPIILCVPPANSTCSRAIVADAASGEGEASDKVCVKLRMFQLNVTCGRFSVSPCQDARKRRKGEDGRKPSRTGTDTHLRRCF